MEQQTRTRTLIADKEYVDKWRGEIFCLIKSYFEKSKDKSSTPGKAMLDLTKTVGFPDHILIVHETNEIPDGFMFGKIVGGIVARILLAFLGQGLDNPSIIKESLDLFDGWAKERKCIAADLYTHRHPKSYRSLAYLGWKHNYTVYRKDYIYG